MFTSRAEYRIMLRQDNADIRLTQLGFDIGLASQQRLDNVNKKIANSQEIIKYFKKTSIKPEEANVMLRALNTSEIPQNYKLMQILGRPQITMDTMIEALPAVAKQLEHYDKDSLLQAEIQMKYEGYIEKEQLMVEKMNKLENINISNSFDFKQIHNLSAEAKEKLSKQKPITLGQAARISGISPADISVLMVHLGR